MTVSVHAGCEEGLARIAADVLQADVVRLSVAVHRRVRRRAGFGLVLQLRPRHLQVRLWLRYRPVVGSRQRTNPEHAVRHGSTYDADMHSAYLLRQRVCLSVCHSCIKTTKPILKLFDYGSPII